MTYTLRELAAEENISYRRLLDWRKKGWLVPAAACGSRERFTKVGFEAASKASLMSLQTAREPRVHIHDPNWAVKLLKEKQQNKKPSDGGSRARGHS